MLRLEGKTHSQDVKKVAQPEIELVNLPSMLLSFGRAVSKLSRKGRSLGHGMLTDNWEDMKMSSFALRSTG